MKIQLRRLPREQYPTDPGLYLMESDDCPDVQICDVTDDGWYETSSWTNRFAELPDGIAWSERIECEVVG